MTIICGTDFSENAEQAALAAAAMAMALNASLKLVHVMPEPAHLFSVNPSEEMLRTALEAQAAKLRARFEIDVEPIILFGSAIDAVLDMATSAKARLIVVAALGAQKQQHWLTGGVAERLAQRSPIPVVVVRDATCLERWARGQQPLRVTIGVDLGPSSLAALRWVEALRRARPCDVCIAQIVFPFPQEVPVGTDSLGDRVELPPMRKAALEESLQAWAGTLLGKGETTFVASPGWGRIDTHLASLAESRDCDLLVVGTHQRAWAARVWQGSVSRGVLHSASSNIACVPPGVSNREED